MDGERMFDLLLNRLRTPTWHLGGYDTFAGEWHGLSGRFFSEQAALRAAQR